MEAKTITLKTLAISIAAVLIVELLVRPLVPAIFNSALPGIAIIRLVQIVLLLVVVGYFEKNSNAIGLSAESIPFGIIRGLIWSGLFGLCALVLMLLFHAVGINTLKMLQTPLPASQLLIVTYFAVGGVIGPIAEEVFFRGILYGYLRRWGVYPAVILSTICFVLPHMHSSSLPITQLVGGVVFALAYEKEKNLMAPITIHCLGNLAIFSITLLT
jgi:membrane protease YdiL (CAAX protease family)